jgi:hypothetical protein
MHGRSRQLSLKQRVTGSQGLSYKPLEKQVVLTSPELRFHKSGFRSQRGEGKLRAVIVTAILALGILVAWKVIPPYSAEYQLADKMQEIARFGIVDHKTEEQIRESVFKTIQDLDIPATRDNIKVTADASKVTISVDYTVPIDILFYHLDLHFTPSSENKSLT